MKKTAIVRILLFVLTLVSFLGSAVFAWSTFVQRTQPIMFYSGRLNVDAKLYKLIDLNYDGIDEDNVYEEVTESFVFTRLVPGQIFSFKIEMTNQGTIPGFLKLEMLMNELSDSDIFEYIELRYIDIETEEMIEENLDYSMMFFQNKDLNPGSSNTYTFYFQMKVKGELGNNFKSVDLVIEKFIITLDQIEQ